MTTWPYSAEEIDDYVLGRLPYERLTTFETALDRDETLAAAVQAHRRDNALLRRLGAPVLAEPVPDRLRQVISAIPAERRTAAPAGAATRRRWSDHAGWRLAASLVLVVAGVGLGWAGRGATTPAMAGCGEIMSEAAAGVTAAAHVEVPSALLVAPAGRRDGLSFAVVAGSQSPVARPAVSAATEPLGAGTPGSR
ncbi:MAG: hypothetical protein EA405_06800 [Rhodospirillales bacterium]|nr:MAG: hypothetical protein EA405_06800 [Rhodospirillales bacterium]